MSDSETGVAAWKNKQKGRVATEETPESVVDYDAIIAAHLERIPSRVWPGLRFAIPMGQDEWRGFARLPGWKYEWDIRRGADVHIRPFGPHYRIPVERRTVAAPCEICSVSLRNDRSWRAGSLLWRMSLTR